MFVYTQPAFPAKKRIKHAPTSSSRPHINTEVLVEDFSWCSWRASQHPAVQSLVLLPKGSKPPYSRLAFFGLATRVQPSRNRVASLISRFRSESGAYSRAPPVLMPSPLRTVWFIDSTGSKPPSTSGKPLMGHSTPVYLTVSSLSREADKSERKVPA